MTATRGRVCNPTSTITCEIKCWDFRRSTGPWTHHCRSDVQKIIILSSNSYSFHSDVMIVCLHLSQPSRTHFTPTTRKKPFNPFFTHKCRNKVAVAATFNFTSLTWVSNFSSIIYRSSSETSFSLNNNSENSDDDSRAESFKYLCFVLKLILSLVVSRPSSHHRGCKRLL